MERITKVGIDENIGDENIGDNGDNKVIKNRLNIGVAGPGVVGGGFLEILSEKRDKAFNILAYSSRNPDNEKYDLIKQNFPNVIGYSDPFQMLEQNEIHIVVETMGTIELAYDFIETALKKGKSVITANKDLMAISGDKLKDIAKRNNVGLYYEASVMGGVPAVDELRKISKVDDIETIYAIVNGTGNFILTEMLKGKEYEDVLKEAQKLGYAESDPTNDVDGIDSYYKLVIMLYEAFGVQPKSGLINVEGITGITKQDMVIAKSLGYTIKLLAHINKEIIGEIIKNKSRVGALVAPFMVAINSKMGMTNGSDNRIEIHTNNRNLGFDGEGAGAKPTGAAIYEDLLECAKNYKDGNYKGDLQTWEQKIGVELTNSMNMEFEHYVSIMCSNIKNDFILKLSDILKEKGLINILDYSKVNKKDGRLNMVLAKIKTSELIELLKPLKLNYIIYRIIN